MKLFFEEMFFYPKWYHYIVIVLLFPLSFIYGLIMIIRRIITPKKKFNIPIISVGNLIVGGSGKTPFVINLASRYEDVTIISRGYGRKTRGYVEVSRHGKILTSVQASGDEAMLIAKSLPYASVIVCEDRATAIEIAMREGAKIIILDDGFNRIEIEKYEILLEPENIVNILPFPSGGLREFYMIRYLANIIVKENRDFKRNVEIINCTEKMVLVTAISNPVRLNKYLPYNNIVDKVYYADHAYFDEKILLNYLKKNKATSILCTSKDRVKLEEFNLPISEIKLKLQINETILAQVDAYIYSKRNS